MILRRTKRTFFQTDKNIFTEQLPNRGAALFFAKIFAGFGVVLLIRGRIYKEETLSDFHN